MRVTFTFRPSDTMVRMAPSPSFVAGIFIITLGLAMRSWSARPAARVPEPSWASDGSTSTLTNPSVPPDTRYRGSKASRAEWMSRTTSSQYASAGVRPRPISEANCSS